MPTHIQRASPPNKTALGNVSKVTVAFHSNKSNEMGIVPMNLTEAELVSGDEQL